MCFVSSGSSLSLILFFYPDLPPLFSFFLSFFVLSFFLSPPLLHFQSLFLSPSSSLSSFLQPTEIPFPSLPLISFSASPAPCPMTFPWVLSFSKFSIPSGNPVSICLVGKADCPICVVHWSHKPPSPRNMHWKNWASWCRRVNSYLRAAMTVLVWNFRLTKIVIILSEYFAFALIFFEIIAHPP